MVVLMCVVCVCDGRACLRVVVCVVIFIFSKKIYYIACTCESEFEMSH